MRGRWSLYDYWFMKLGFWPFWRIFYPFWCVLAFFMHFRSSERYVMYETLIEKWVLRSFWGVKLLSTINISWDTAILGFCWRQQEICSTVNKKIICPSKFFDIIVIEELYFEKQSFILPETARPTCFWPPANTLFFKSTSIQRPTTPNMRRFSPFFRCRPT